MKQALLEQIIHAVLYEGYILYPYRPSSTKNRNQRFTFGRVYPEVYSAAQKGAEPCVMQTECIFAMQTESAEIEVSVRFLQPMLREIGVLEEPRHEWGETEPQYKAVSELKVNGELFQTWHEAVERTVNMPTITNSRQTELAGLGRITLQLPFEFTATRRTEPLRDGRKISGLIVRRQAGLSGRIEVVVKRLKGELFKITVRVINQSPVHEAELNSDEAVLLSTFASTHAILKIQNGSFVSLLDPEAECAEVAAACQNTGVWPVFVGDEEKKERDTILASPIILYDYPKIAAESPGSLYDGTEIDEILTLRILSMTEQEKMEMRRVDELARRLLERTESLTDAALLKLHGKMLQPGEPAQHEVEDSAAKMQESAPIEFDDFFGANTRLKGAFAGEVYLQPGDRVRIRPKARADMIDMALEGQTAVVEAVEQDLENRIHLAVVFENDPGKDLGLLRQPGHRFFYGLDEVEPVLEGAL